MKNEEFVSSMQALLDSAGVELANSSEDVARYALQRATFLATVVGRPGYSMAVIAERDNVALYAGISGVALADANQTRLIGIIQGALSIGAQVVTA